MLLHPPFSSPSVLAGGLPRWSSGLWAAVCHSHSAETDCDCGRWAGAWSVTRPRQTQALLSLSFFFFLSLFFFSQAFTLCPLLSWSWSLPRLSLSIFCQWLHFSFFVLFSRSSVFSIYVKCASTGDGFQIPLFSGVRTHRLSVSKGLQQKAQRCIFKSHKLVSSVYFKLDVCWI